MAGPARGSQEYLAETNDPYLDQRVSITFVVANTLFLAIFYTSRYYNPKAICKPMLICNTLCYLFCLGSAVVGILMTQIGSVGHHVDAVPVTTLQTWLKLSKALEFTYTPAVMFAKLAALFLYYQLFQITRYRIVILGLGAVIALQGVVALILAFTICRPFHYFWTQAVDPAGGSCGNVMLFYKLYSVPSLATDVVMLVLPWPILLGLQMPLDDKVGLLLTFLAASLGIVTCARRFSVFFTTPLFSDPTWYASGGPMLYALIEPSIYMMASILPTTRHLIRRVRRRLRGKPAVPNSTGSARSAKSAAENNRSGGWTPRRADPWLETTTTSQEELTLGDWDLTQDASHRPPKDAEEEVDAARR